MVLIMKSLWRLAALLPLFAHVHGHALARREMIPNPAFVTRPIPQNFVKLPSMRRIDSSTRRRFDKARQHVKHQQNKLNNLKDLKDLKDPALQKMQQNNDFINRLLEQDPKKPLKTKKAATNQPAKEMSSEVKGSSTAALKTQKQAEDKTKETLAKGTVPGSIAPQSAEKPAAKPNNVLLSDWSDWSVGSGGSLKYGGH